MEKQELKPAGVFKYFAGCREWTDAVQLAVGTEVVAASC